MFLNGAYAKGKESDEKSLDTAAYLDISLLPIGPRRLEGRARADLRWIGADYSTRYRLRLEARARA